MEALSVRKKDSSFLKKRSKKLLLNGYWLQWHPWPWIGSKSLFASFSSEKEEFFFASAGVLAAIACALPALAARTPDRGTLRCAVVAEQDDWTKADQHGDLSALNTEICRAVAAARGASLVITNFPVEQSALNALRAGKEDIAAGITPTPEASVTAHIGPPYFYDMLALLRVAPNGPICAADGSDAEALIGRAIPHAQLFSFQEEGEMESALLTRHCAALAAPLSRLGQIRATYGAKLGVATITPLRLTVTPLSAATSLSDPKLGAVADWTIAALLQAESLGLTQANVRTWHDDGDILAQRLTGAIGNAGHALGLRPDWALSVIANTGNYGEIYARTVGANAPIRLPRGQNALWRDGGLMAASPVQ